MAEGQEDRNTDELSDEPSPYRLEEYRRKGRVAQSRELSSMIALLAGGTTLYLWAPSMSEQLTTFMESVFRADFSARLNFEDPKVLLEALVLAMKNVVHMALPIGIIAFIVAALGSYVQIGSVFSTEPLVPDLKRIDPVRGLKRYFSLKMVYDALRLILRASCVAMVAFILVKTRVLQSPQFLLNDPNGILEEYSYAARVIFGSLCVVFLVFSLFDLWIQRWEFSKGVRLTKQEAKQEHKEHEGDPLIKARIRSVQREIARKRMMDAVKTADVVVTNPTHIAVALLYKTGEMNAPKVVAKGADFVAQKIKKIAAENNVPRVENVPLARTLYRSVKVGQLIPRTLFKAVAEVLAFVYKLKNKGMGSDPR